MGGQDYKHQADNGLWQDKALLMLFYASAIQQLGVEKAEPEMQTAPSLVLHQSPTGRSSARKEKGEGDGQAKY